MNSCLKPSQDDFTAVYEAYFRKIYNFLYFRTFHRETTEDLVSQVFLKAFKKYSDFDPAKGSVAAWLYAIARHSLIDHFRRQKPAVDIDEVYGLAVSFDLPHDLEVKEKLKEVRNYLSQIKKEHREIIILRLWDNLSYNEISRLTGKKEGACKMLFSRAIKSLRQEIILALIIFSLLIIN